MNVGNSLVSALNNVLRLLVLLGQMSGPVNRIVRPPLFKRLLTVEKYQFQAQIVVVFRAFQLFFHDFREVQHHRARNGRVCGAQKVLICEVLAVIMARQH